MAASGMAIRTVDDSRDPEAGDAELLAHVSSDECPPAAVPSSSSDSSSFSTLKCRAVSSLAIASLAGLLFFAAYAHFSRATYEVVAAIEDAEQLQFAEVATTCPGTMSIPGLGLTALINTKSDSETTAVHQIDVQGDTLVAHMGGRAYFGDQCVENTYDNNYYAASPLLGNTLRYTIDLAGAGCGCNAAVYLVSMKQNTQVSTCGDYYCDANSVCGVKCTEVDIMEANMYAFHSTLHAADDGTGQGFGYGGTGGLQSSWEDGQYGPGGRCIDTTRPFDVAVSFPVAADNTLQGMKVTLSQAGSPCPLSSMISNYQANGRDGLLEISKALADGMTPVVSYWSADDMGWLDGKGPQGGACEADHSDQCPDAVKVYGISYETGADGSAPSASMPAMPAQPASNGITPGLQDAQASEWEAANVGANIMPVPNVDDPEWAIYPGKDTFSFADVHRMSAADIGACKAYASINSIAAFVVWRGDCYFRQQSGPACRDNLKDSSEATAYISRSSLASAEMQATPAAVVSPSVAGAPPAGVMPVLGVPGWEKTQTSAGEVYYYNVNTGETSWSLPQ
jgi:hypothetical protein